MSIWDRIREWKTKNAQKFIYCRIAPERTRDPSGTPITAHKGYVRVQLADMFLGKSRDWFKDWQPCVSTSVRLELDGKPGQTLTHVARPPEKEMANGVRVGYPVTDLLPFSGGVVEIEAALLALQGKAYISEALGVLSSFSDLLAAPIGQAIGVADRIATGLDKLVGAVDGQVHLGFHDSFGSAGGNNTLTSGYLAVILATPGQLDPAKLGVGEKRLFIEQANEWQPLLGFDYILYYVEGREERDNWRLPSIQVPLEKAIEAAVLGENADAYKKAALVAALTCKELTPLDRRRVAAAVKEEIEQATESGRGAVGDGKRDLDAVVAERAVSPAMARTGDVPTEADILA